MCDRTETALKCILFIKNYTKDFKGQGHTFSYSSVIRVITAYVRMNNIL